MTHTVFTPLIYVSLSLRLQKLVCEPVLKIHLISQIPNNFKFCAIAILKII